MRCLQFQGQSQFRDSQLSISMVDKPHSFQQTFPMYPTLHYHDLDSYQHMRGPQQTTKSALSLDSSHNE